MGYKFREKEYSTLSKLYEDFKDDSPVGYQTVRSRLKDGLSVEEALFNPKKRTGWTPAGGTHAVEGVIYETIPDIAREYNLKKNTVYQRYNRGKRGDDLVPPKKRKNYVEPKKEIKYKLYVEGKGFKSEAEACRHYGVKFVTYRKRKYKGYSPEECLGLKKIFDRRTLRKGKKINKASPKLVKLEVEGEIYTSYAALARAYDLSPHVVNQRIKKYGYSPEEAVIMKGKATQVTIEGKKYKSMAEASRAYGKTSNQVLSLMDKGLSLEQALGVEDYETTRSIKFDGELFKNLRDLAEKKEIPYSRLTSRLNSGFSLEKAIKAGSEKIIGEGRYNKKIIERDPELASRVSFLYFVQLKLKVDEKDLYKIGITTRSVKKRLRSIRHQIIRTHKATLFECFEKEQKILKRFKSKRVHSIGGETMDGYTEVLELSNKEVSYLKDYFDKINIDN
jgi:hypothetical protein